MSLRTHNPGIRSDFGKYRYGNRMVTQSVLTRDRRRRVFDARARQSNHPPGDEATTMIDLHRTVRLLQRIVMEQLEYGLSCSY
jgi:hypothetical protein